jgi:hypothetical protein
MIPSSGVGCREPNAQLALRKGIFTFARARTLAIIVNRLTGDDE